MFAEDVQVDVPYKRFFFAWVHRARALDRGDASDQGACLGVAGEVAQEVAFAFGDSVPGLSDNELVDVASPPAVAVAEHLRRFPGGKDVVFGVSVQVDHARQDDAISFDDSDRRVGLRGADGDDRWSGDEDVAVFELLGRRDDAALQRKGLRWDCPACSRSVALGRLWEFLGNAECVARVEGIGWHVSSRGRLSCIALGPVW